MDAVAFCPNCGNPRAPGSKFCTQCGRAFDADTPAASVQTPNQAAFPHPTPSLLAEPPHNQSTPPRTPSRRSITQVLIGLIATLAILAIGLGWVLYSTNQDLTRTRSDLAATRAALFAEATAHSNANESVQSLTTQKSELQAVLSRQTDCISQLVSELAELERIDDLSSANFNRFAKGSTWGKAVNARDVALIAATRDFFEAYLAAFNRQLTKANSWVDKGNAQIKIANSKTTVINHEVDTGDTATDTIQSALDTLLARVDATKASCSAGSP